MKIRGGSFSYYLLAIYFFAIKIALTFISKKKKEREREKEEENKFHLTREIKKGNIELKFSFGSSTFHVPILSIVIFTYLAVSMLLEFYDLIK